MITVPTAISALMQRPIDADVSSLRTAFSGSAPLPVELFKKFEKATGVEIVEGYGLTETSPVVSVGMNADHHFKIGTVGKPISNVEVKIAEDGEILIKGPNVMKGYFKDPEKTAEVMSGDYFHTGDKGEIDPDGFIKITGRKKEMFKTSGGKYVAPQVVENAMKESFFIEQIMVIGDGEKMPAAFIQLNFDFVEDWAKRKGFEIGTSAEEIIKNPRLLDRIQKEIDNHNKQFGNWEKVKKFELTPDIWSIESGHLTPTMKLKRKVIKEKYTKLYSRIYSHNS